MLPSSPSHSPFLQVSFQPYLFASLSSAKGQEGVSEPSVLSCAHQPHPQGLGISCIIHKQRLRWILRIRLHVPPCEQQLQCTVLDVCKTPDRLFLSYSVNSKWFQYYLLVSWQNCQAVLKSLQINSHLQLTDCALLKNPAM